MFIVSFLKHLGIHNILIEKLFDDRYNEVCDPGYTFNPAPAFGGMAGHFTQVVWKTSLKLGIGRAEGKVNGDKCIFSVARYREAGNYGGKFEENVKQGFFYYY